MKKVVAIPFNEDTEIRSAKDLGDAIRAARTQSEMTLENFAIAIGLSKQTLSDIELGKTTVNIGNVMLAAKGAGICMFAFPTNDRELVKFKLSQTV